MYIVLVLNRILPFLLDVLWNVNYYISKLLWGYIYIYLSSLTCLLSFDIEFIILRQKLYITKPLEKKSYVKVSLLGYYYEHIMAVPARHNVFTIIPEPCSCAFILDTIRTWIILKIFQIFCSHLASQRGTDSLQAPRFSLVSLHQPSTPIRPNRLLVRWLAHPCPSENCNNIDRLHLYQSK